LSTIFCAVPARMRVEPAMGSAAVIASIAMSASRARTVPAAFTTAIVIAPFARAAASALCTNAAEPLAETPIGNVAFSEVGHARGTGNIVVFGALDRTS